MTEERVTFLYKAATLISSTQNIQVNPLLQSYYLLRCHDLTRSYGLPSKQFSSNLRCSRCCQEWKYGNYETKVLPIKLSKNQRRRIRCQKETCKNKEDVKQRKSLLESNKLERICKVCGHTTVLPMIKPNKINKNKCNKAQAHQEALEDSKKSGKANLKTLTPQNMKQKKEINVYCNTQDIFSLQNKSNNISGSVVEIPKVIKNHKKKKDKYAGLCKQAVLASAKLKGLENKSKLNLFLKPSQ